MGGREELLVHSEDGPGGLNVVVSGRLDASSAADARLWMHEVIDSGSGPIWLDLGECTVGDSTALGLLLASVACGLDFSIPEELARFADQRGNLLALAIA